MRTGPHLNSDRPQVKTSSNIALSRGTAIAVPFFINLKTRLGVKKI